MTAVVIDASAGVEIVAETRRGRALARLIPAGSEGWVPEHFYAEVLAVLRRRCVIEGKLTDSQATAAVSRLASWHLHHASVAPVGSKNSMCTVTWVDARGIRGLPADDNTSPLGAPSPLGAHKTDRSPPEAV